ncbi:SepM family pheromone-processing serine protease [Thermoactinomyces vulgaris]|uniref:SepM family pheromone-processing serine protease n=1 Tax=Thermoactinomyces vulgaris TaxID=2026 RepID=UPI00362C7C97
MNSWTKRERIPVIAFIGLVAVIGALFLVPIPYYTISPGSAEDVSPLVNVKGHPPDEQGDFYLTTVSMKEGVLIDYLYSFLSGNVDLIHEEKVLAEGESDEDYERRQAESMQMSQNHAVIAAYRYAGKPVTVRVRGIEVLRLIDGSGGLEEGDLITQIDHQPVRSVEQLTGYLSRKKAGEKVHVRVVRQQTPRDLLVRLTSLPATKGKEKAGLGIVPVLKTEIQTDPSVRIDSAKIGGPSAGLMFSLEVLNRLMPEDLTRGYRIAGTGTISPDGQVGQIGGIEYKITAAAEKGAELFFCPADKTPADQNEKLAKATVKAKKFPMKVIPVRSLNEAVEYLKRLPSQKH